MAVSADFNYVDLVWHELEFREGYSFTYARGFYAKLYNALRRWVADAFPFKKAYYSNSEIPDVGDADGRPPS